MRQNATGTTAGPVVYVINFCFNNAQTNVAIAARAAGGPRPKGPLISTHGEVSCIAHISGSRMSRSRCAKISKRGRVRRVSMSARVRHDRRLQQDRAILHAEIDKNRPARAVTVVAIARDISAGRSARRTGWRVLRNLSP